MINFCTTGDSKYLLKGLALYQSLKNTVGEGNFKLHWLCIDRDIYNKLFALNLKEINPVYLMWLENADDELRAAQNNPPTNYGSQRDNYIWSLTPYFINYILNYTWTEDDETVDLIKDDEYLVYVDNDIYFYESPQAILDYINGKSMGIHTHRFTPTRKKKDTGWYNVGVTVVKKDKIGKMIANLWKGWVISPDHPHKEEYGTCGDQGYLVLLVSMFPSRICVFDEGSNISHLAPWCCELDGRPVYFFHFSHFNFDLLSNTWTDNNHGEWKPTRHEHIKPYYQNYFEEIKKANKVCQS